MKEYLYSITFDNGAKFKGGTSYYKSEWTSIPDNRRIKIIFYKLPNGGYLKLEDFNSYFHMIEATINLTGRKKGRTKLAYAYIMGKQNNIITCYKIKLINRPTDEIVNIQTYNENDEYITKLNPRGWKLGMI